MSRHTPSKNWWHRNRLECWKYPEFPTQKELIYRVFRAAYPHGAFVDDDLKLVELRDKDTIWNNLDSQFDKAHRDLDEFLGALFAEEPRLRSSQKKQAMVREYYLTLLGAAKYALFVSQNGHYYEFRCMEELLVRHRQVSKSSWMKDLPESRFKLPPIEGFRVAKQYLEPSEQSEIKILQSRQRMVEEGKLVI
ncbi:hypothetical protein F5Y04DRAFT_257369 [Hypomontagnella monticulosa]|nr:hypothetical protein F5Y04DRAFT_257369 [Hypomontagnella monticulosa]